MQLKDQDKNYSEPHFHNCEHIDMSSCVWRYMSYAKFEDLLTTRSLYFCRADKFSDFREATFPDSYFLNLAEELALKYPDMSEDDIWEAMTRERISMRYKIEHSYISCWRLDDQFRSNLLTEYGQVKDGIAILSSLEKLKNNIFSGKDKNRIMFASVSYEDFNSLSEIKKLHPSIELVPAIAKQLHYKWEREIRIMLFYYLFHIYDHPPFEKGTNIPVNIEGMIDKIFITKAFDSGKKLLLLELLSGFNLQNKLIEIDFEAYYDHKLENEILTAHKKSLRPREKPHARTEKFIHWKDKELKALMDRIGTTDLDYFISHEKQPLLEAWLNGKQLYHFARSFYAEGNVLGTMEHAARLFSLGIENSLLGVSTQAIELMIKALEHENWSECYRYEGGTLSYTYQDIVNLVNELDFQLQPLKFKILELLRKENEKYDPGHELDGIENYAV